MTPPSVVFFIKVSLINNNFLVYFDEELYGIVYITTTIAGISSIGYYPYNMTELLTDNWEYKYGSNLVTSSFSVGDDTTTVKLNKLSGDILESRMLRSDNIMLSGNESAIFSFDFSKSLIPIVGFENFELESYGINFDSSDGYGYRIFAIY